MWLEFTTKLEPIKSFSQMPKHPVSVGKLLTPGRIKHAISSPPALFKCMFEQLMVANKARGLLKALFCAPSPQGV